MDVKDRIVLVTGAAGGIGRAPALRFAGARAFVCGRPMGGRRKLSRTCGEPAAAAA